MIKELIKNKIFIIDKNEISLFRLKFVLFIIFNLIFYYIYIFFNKLANEIIFVILIIRFI